MKTLSLFFLFSVIFINNNAFSAESNCKSLGDKLYNCKKFECDTTSPENKNKKVHNEIVGYNKDGDCVHIQTDPNGDKVTCKYSEESRKFLSIRMKKAGADLINLPESSQFEENILADIFHNECDVQSENGDDDKPKIDDSESNLEENDNDDSDPSSQDQDDNDKKSNTKGKVEDNGDLRDFGTSGGQD